LKCNRNVNVDKLTNTRKKLKNFANKILGDKGALNKIIIERKYNNLETSYLIFAKERL
jgi:hypothetical protein